MRKHWFVRLAVLLILSAIASAKIETVNRPASSPVPDAVWQVLDPKGYHVVLDDGTVACDIWLRKSVPSTGKKDVEGALYPQLASSTLVGVISLSAGATDYRGEPIKAGFYTLRYELLPNDGNHLGVAPNRDFLLLIPAASDPDPNAQFKSDALVNLSRGATGTPHPGPLSLVQPGSSNPGVAKDDQDHWVFSGKLTLASGEDLPFGLIVKGTAQQ